MLPELGVMWTTVRSRTVEDARDILDIQKTSDDTPSGSHRGAPTADPEPKAGREEFSGGPIQRSEP